MRGRRVALLACGLACVLAVLGGRSALWERDEPRFALAARSVIEEGAWHAPRVLGVVRHQKPPLTAWAMAISVAVLGPTPAAVRLPSAAAAGVVVLATWWLVAARGMPTAAPWAAVCLATSPLIWIEGLAATADALVLACTTVYLALLLPAQHPRRGSARVLAAAAAGAAWLAKSVAAVVPLFTLAIVAASTPIRADRRRLVRDGLWTSLVGACALGVWLWGLSGEGEASLHLSREIVARAVVGVDGHTLPWWMSPLFYGAVAIVGAAPWSLLIVSAPGAAWRALRAEPACLAVIAAPLIVCLAMRTALPHYLLAAWPGLAWLTATMLVSATPASAVVLGRRAVVLLAMATLIELALLAWLARQPLLPVPGFAMAVLGVLLIALAAAAALPLWRGRLAIAGAVLAIGTTAALTWTAATIAPPVAAAQVTVRAATRLADIARPGDVVCLSSRTEAGVAFHGPPLVRWRRVGSTGATPCDVHVGTPDDEAPGATWPTGARVEGLDLVHGGMSTLVIARRSRSHHAP